MEGAKTTIAKPLEQPVSTRPGRTNRRNFIVYYLGGLMGAIGLFVIAPVLVYIFPPAGKSKPKDVMVTLDRSLDDLKEGEGLSFDAPKETGFIMKDGGGDNYPGKIGFKGYAIKVGKDVLVLSATCSHLGCSVTLDTGGKKFDCPCHGSIFKLNGDVTHGPAIAPLSHYTWKKGQKPNEIMVTALPLPGVG